MSYDPVELKQALTAVLKSLSYKTLPDVPTNLVDQTMLNSAIAKIPQPDMSAYLTKDALNGYVVKGELPDFTKFAVKADIPDIAPLAKQVDLSLVEKYGLPRNYWVVNSQTNGYSMDSDGHTTIANDKAQTSSFITLDRSSQLAFMGWGGHTNDQVTVAYFDADKKMISSIIWTQLKELTGPIMIEFWKYGPSAAAYVRINANFGVGQRMMVCSEVFQNAEWMPAIEDIQTGSHDTGWISVDGSSYPNNTPEKQYGGVQLRVVDQTATLVFYIDHIAPGLAFKIPPKYAPRIPMWDTYVRGGTVNYLIDTDGTFTINGPASGQTYNSGNYLNGVITYLIA